VPLAIANQPALRERLRREARAAATISSLAVATVYALEEIDGHLLIASECVSGPTVRQLVAAGPMAPARARAIAMDVARALVAAHAAGVVHRDLKPENIVVDQNGRAKVVDFGIAYLDDGDTRLTRAGQVLGTPAYMSPEQLAGADVDGRTDIFSMGLVVQEMLLGRHPAMSPRAGAGSGAGGGAGHPSDGAAHAAGKAQGSSPAAPGHDTDAAGMLALQAVAMRCTQTDPDARYPTAQDALAALEAVHVAGDPASTPRLLLADGGTGTARSRWWWEFHQGAAAVAYAAMLVPAWRVRGDIGGPTGRLLFTAAAMGAIVAILLRLHLWFTSRSYPAELMWARDRAHRWITTADWVFVVSLAVSAALIGPRSTLDVVLVACSVGTAVAFLVIEPATARAAGLTRQR
jgi:hypothetical protein